MFFLDANILLEVALNQDRAEECAAFLQQLESGIPTCYLTDFLLYSMLLTILRYESSAVARKFLAVVSSYERLLIYRPTLQDLDATLVNMTRLKLDFDDAFVVTVMHQTGITTLVSIDHHFDSIPGLHRVEPSDAQSLL